MIVLNGVLYVLTIGYRWIDMLVRYGSYKTAWDRFSKWSKAEVNINFLQEYELEYLRPRLRRGVLQVGSAEKYTNV